MLSGQKLSVFKPRKLENRQTCAVGKVSFKA